MGIYRTLSAREICQKSLSARSVDPQLQHRRRIELLLFPKSYRRGARHERLKPAPSALAKN